MFLFFSVNLYAQSICSNGWKLFEYSFYNIVRHDANVSWYKARRICVSQGGKLVKIDDDREQEFIHEEIKVGDQVKNNKVNDEA